MDKRIRKKTKTFLKDNAAQIGGIFYFIVVIFGFGLAFVMLGYMVDYYVTFNNELIADTSMVTSQAKIDSLNILFRYWQILPFLVTFLLFFFLIKNALKEREGEI